MANISTILADMNRTIYGAVMLPLITAGMTAINDSEVALEGIQTALEVSQTTLQNIFDDEISNLTAIEPNSAELVAAHISTITAEEFDTIGNRMDDHDTQLADIVDTQLADIVYNIKQFGAIADDPAIDNIDAINAAIVFVNSIGGGTVYIPKGIFYVAPALGHKIMFLSNIRMMGNYVSSTIKLKNNAGNFYTLCEGQSILNVALFGVIFDFNVQNNLTCDITSVGGVSKEQNFLCFISSKNIKFEGNKLINFGGFDGFSCWDVGTENIEMHHNHVEWVRGLTTSPGYDNSCTYIYGKNIKITDNTFYSAPENFATTALEYGATNSIVTGNIADGFRAIANIVEYPLLEYATIQSSIFTGNICRNGLIGVYLWSVTNILKNVIIADNYIELNQTNYPQPSWGSGIHFDRTHSGNFEDIKIHDNIIKFNPVDTRAGSASLCGIGIDLCLFLSGSNSKNIDIYNNTIIDSPSIGLYIGHSTGNTLKNVNFLGNKLINCGRNPNETASNRAHVFSDGGENVKIEGNQFIDEGIDAPLGRYWSNSTYNPTKFINFAFDITKNEMICNKGDLTYSPHQLLAYEDFYKYPKLSYDEKGFNLYYHYIVIKTTGIYRQTSDSGTLGTLDVAITGDPVSGSKIMAVSNSDELKVGNTITGTGCVANQISAIYGNNLTLENNCTSTETGVAITYSEGTLAAI